MLVVALAWRLPVNRWIVFLTDQLRGMGAMGVGFAYGPVGGLLVASPASVLGATTAFLLSRTMLRGWIEKQTARFPKARALDKAIGKNSFKLILLLRLSPLIPFNVLNYALGLSDARVGRYVVASFIGMLPSTWMYVYLGSFATTAVELTDASSGGGRQRLLLTIAGRLAAVIVVVLVTRSARQVLNEELKKPPGD